MRTHLEARLASATSRRRPEEAVSSPVNDEINKLRAQLEKLAIRNNEAAQFTSTSPFSVEIQQALLPVGFRMPTMAMYEGKTDPLDHLDVLNDQMDLLQVTMLARCRCFAVRLSGQPRSGFAKSNRRPSPLGGNYQACLCASSKELASMQLL